MRWCWSSSFFKLHINVMLRYALNGDARPNFRLMRIRWSTEHRRRRRWCCMIALSVHFHSHSQSVWGVKCTSVWRRHRTPTFFFRDAVKIELLKTNKLYAFAPETTTIDSIPIWSQQWTHCVSFVTNAITYDNSKSLHPSCSWNGKIWFRRRRQVSGNQLTVQCILIHD